MAVVEFKLPDLGEGIHEAEILDIKVKEGDTVKEDQVIFEVETDKAAVEVPCPVAGVVEKIMVKVGQIAHVGNTIITFKTGDAGLPQTKAQPSEVPEEIGHHERAAVPAGKMPANGKTLAGGSSDAGNGRSVAVKAAPTVGPVPATPATRKLARDLNVDLRLIQGSGPAGRVTKEDVRAFAEGVPSSAKAGATIPGAAAGAEKQPAHKIMSTAQSIAAKYGASGERAEGGPLGGGFAVEPAQLPDFSKQGPTERVALRSLRRKIAQSMTQSWVHVPRVSTFDEADITDLEALRVKHEKAVAKHGGKLTITAITIKAVISALKKFPEFNTSLDEATSEIVFKHYYNIGIAVATDRGLIVPVIKNADQKSLIELSVELADIAQKTRDGKIEVERLQGGTFTITNTGPIGGTGSVPMVNYPEVAIMGMARSAEKPVVRNGQIVVRNILPLSFSFDHRVADGAEAAMFLRHVATCLEDPFQMLLEV